MDFAPDATPRYIAKYSVCGLEHSIMVRFARGAAMLDSVAEGQLIFHGAFDALSAVLCDNFAWVDAIWIPQDTEISVPATVPDAVTGTQPQTIYSIADKISHLTVSGKGTAGGRVHWQLYGTQQAIDGVTGFPAAKDFVFHAGESSDVDDMRAVFGRSSIRAIDNTHPAIRSDVTYKINDFWLKKARKGGISIG